MEEETWLVLTNLQVNTSECIYMRISKDMGRFYSHNDAKIYCTIMNELIYDRINPVIKGMDDFIHRLGFRVMPRGMEDISY